MKFEIRNRYTGAVQVTAEIDTDSESVSTRLGLAVKWAIKSAANLRDAYLGGVDLRGANLRGANLDGVDLRGANLDGAYLGGAYLRGAYLGGAYLGGANLRGANLDGAYLGGANLGGANLGGAYLRGAYLGGAYLGGAYLREQWVIQGPARSDGYFFMLTSFKDEGVRLKAGCRNFTMAEARTHWQKTRAGTPLGDETFAILDCLEAMAKARGLAL